MAAAAARIVDVFISKVSSNKVQYGTFQASVSADDLLLSSAATLKLLYSILAIPTGAKLAVVEKGKPWM